MWKFLIFCVCLAFTTPASAQLAKNCKTYDTTVVSPSLSSVITDCTTNTGRWGMVHISVSGELTCTTPSDAIINIFATSTATIHPLGANFVATIASGVMNVTSMITPPNFIIEQGDNLYDGLGGGGIPIGTNGQAVTVGTQIDGTPGGIGHYNISDLTMSASADTIWALYTYAGQPGSPTGGFAAGRDVLEQLACRDGKTYMTTRSGYIPNQFNPNANIRILVGFGAEKFGSVQAASWKNGQISLLTMDQMTGGIVQ